MSAQKSLHENLLTNNKNKCKNMNLIKKGKNIRQNFYPVFIVG